MKELLKIDGLRTQFYTDLGIVRAMEWINILLNEGETLALVGESGCGRTMTALSILRLHPPSRKDYREDDPFSMASTPSIEQIGYAQDQGPLRFQ